MDAEQRERWRQAVRDHEALQSPDARASDPAVLWQAMQGQLPPVQARAAIAEALAGAHGHEELRLYLELERDLGGARSVVPLRRPRAWLYWGGGLAAAAALLVLMMRPAAVPQPPESGAVRAPSSAAVESVVDRATLSREAFELVWSPAGQACTYTVRVSTAGGDVLVASAAVQSPSFRLPPATLAQVSSGGMLLWQVDYVCDGVSGQSRTFSTTVGR